MKIPSLTFFKGTINFSQIEPCGINGDDSLIKQGASFRSRIICLMLSSAAHACSVDSKSSRSSSVNTLSIFVSLFLFILIFSLFIFFSPNTLGHSDNYIPGNSMVTPASIVPE